MVFTRSALSSGSTNVYTTPVASKSTSSKKTSPGVHARAPRKPRVCYRKYFEDDEVEVVSHNQTRSSFSTPPAAAAASASAAPAARSIFTRSAKEAALRNYKIYTPKQKAPSTKQPTVCVEQEETPVFVPRRSPRVCRKLNYQSAFDENDDSSVSSTNSETVVGQQPVKYSCPYYSGEEDDQDQEEVYCDEEAYDAANTLTSLNSSHEKAAYEITERCINPVTPCVRYVYRFKATCPEKSQHYVTCYILYDENTRRYHLLNKHTLLTPNDGSTDPEVHGFTQDWSFQSKYVSYMRDTIEKYVMNVLIHKSVQHVITAEFIGLVINDADYKRLFDVDACFYDIENLFTIQNSRQTTSGHEMFILTPEMYYTEKSYEGLQIQDALSILSGQH
jgi:hypothetical protein